MLKIYLDTSIFNFSVDESRGEAHKCSVELFRRIGSGKYKGYISDSVSKELLDDRTDKASQMMLLIDKYNIAVLQVEDSAKRLAEIYISEGIIPKRYLDDALHIAVTAVYRLDIIVSMNFQHIVKQKTIQMTAEINKRHGLKAIKIISPMEAIYNGKN